MLLIFLSFFSWVLTILAPCVLPILPVILSGSFWDIKNKNTPYIIIWALSFSLFIFSILLKVSTLFINIPQNFWKYISWSILIFIWGTFLLPRIWRYISSKTKFQEQSQNILEEASNKNGFLRNILIWFSLGPVFSSCSPTYLLILSIILPAHTWIWIIYLTSYILWLSSILLMITIFWQKFIRKAKWASNPNGTFKKLLWIILILVWFSVISWLDKYIESKVLDAWLCSISSFEQQFLDAYKK